MPRPSAPQRPASAHATRAVALRCGDMNRSSHQGKAAGENPKAKTKHCLALPCPRVRHGSQARERSTKKPGSCCTRTAEATRANDSDAHARRRHRHAPSGSAVHGSCLASTVRPVQRRTRMAAWLTGRADGRPGSMGGVSVEPPRFQLARACDDRRARLAGRPRPLPWLPSLVLSHTRTVEHEPTSGSPAPPRMTPSR